MSAANECDFLFLPLEHKIHIFEPTCNVLLLYRHTNDGVIDDFPKISDHFPNISEDSSKCVRMLHERCRTFSENFRRLPKTFEEDPKIFRSYTNELKYNLRDKLDISESIDILTSEDMENTPLESRIWLRMNFTSGVFSSKTIVSV